MPTFEELYSQLPARTQTSIIKVWESLPESERKNLQNLFIGFPLETNLNKLLLDLSIQQVRLAFGQKHRVVIVGPANVGKSTLYNQLVRSKTDLAEVSPIPGTTRVSQEADAGLFAVIDTPGADAVGEVGDAEKRLALESARHSDFLIILFDAIQGIKKSETELFDELVNLEKPYLVAVNKVDLVKKEEAKIIQLAARNLNINPEHVIPIVAKDGKNLERLLLTIAATEPGIVAALGQAMPQYRWQLAWRAIMSAASLSAVIALMPLPFIDFAPLAITQAAMVLSIARIYNYNITLERAKELLATFGFGFLGRTLFMELSKLGGIPGWVLGTAIATSITVAMGYAASIWFEKGEKITSESLKKITQNTTNLMIESIKKLGIRKPSQKKLQEIVIDSLESATMSEDRSILDKQVD
ncbi:MAG TPA: GTP-binding protein [Anaerolineaceae bacterium]|nr:GTP-binding protein [Anaerolineaceae bacterium]HPN51725.1 GTP-binding protein [Anaerolineaceae bacterium]